MAKVVKHAWTHRPRAQGGTDPIDATIQWCQMRTTGNVTAGAHAVGDNYALPFHADYSESGLTNAGWKKNGVGGIILPSAGLYYIHTQAFFGDTDWQTKNFQLGHTFTQDGQTFDDVIGSNNLGGETLFDSMAHDGTGITPNTIDRRKPEMQLINVFLCFESFALPCTLWPTYYSYTASETTNWNEFETTVFLVASGGSSVMTT